MVVTGMAIGTLAVVLLTQVDSGSGSGQFLTPFVLLGFAVGLSVSPCTDTIMGSFPEKRTGGGGGVNDTALELGGSLGIAVLGSLLATSYRDNLTDSVGDALPHEALDVARGLDRRCVGCRREGRPDPGDRPRPGQGTRLSRRQRVLRCVATTSIAAAVIMGGGTLIVMALLPAVSAKPRPRRPRRGKRRRRCPETVRVPGRTADVDPRRSAEVRSVGPGLRPRPAPSS